MRPRPIVWTAATAALLGSLATPRDATAQAMELTPVGEQHQASRAGGEGMGFFSVGWQRLALGDLNARLEAAGYPAFSEDFLSLGGSGHFLHQRVLIGGEGHGLIGSSETTADGRFRTRLTGGYGLFNLGYALVQGPRATVFPMAGIGGGGVVLDILDRDAPSFDDVLQNPHRDTRLTSGGLMLDASLGLVYRLTTGPRRARRAPGGLALGVRAGYTFSPFATEWRTGAGNDVADGPDTALQGAYVRVMLGGWGGRPPRAGSPRRR